jgi:23S rRNA pseudouridine1911/1915/1917 synthase
LKLKESHKVPYLDKPIRLQEYAVGIFSTIPTKSGIKKAIKKGLVFVNSKVATTALFISGNESIELYQEEVSEPKRKFIFPLKIIYEDDFLAVILKPSGIVVSGNSFANINNALEQNLKPSSQKDAVIPRAVHRLDYPTSGLLLISKTNSTTHYLAKLFEEKRIQKTYYAVTIGKMKNEGEIDILIDEKESKSEFKVLQSIISEKYGVLNLVELNPKTGRRHQLRKHLHGIGNPILGDKEYYIENLISFGNGLYLHATSLEFNHPVSGEKITVSSELPKKFKRLFPNIAL